MKRIKDFLFDISIIWMDFRQILWMDCKFIPSFLLFPINNFKNWYQTRDIKVGSVVETCWCVPAIVEAITYDWNGKEGVDVIDLFNGGRGSCSIRHCGIYVLTTEKLSEMIRQHNEKEL